MNWIIDLSDGSQDVLQCDQMGVSQDGTLLAFVNGVPNPMVIKGYAPGQWLKFHRSTLRSN